ncbi:nucleotide sugar dehydrogenase [Stackebrandtia albiflava]|uniref:Nucleotide sugar dehydrogenase n=1 Tax=Stackebrandtia albiflava TaxID=406432 RepID=A0A562V4B7_9ACTN|nr:nucleotide sugar dehydrogenase [Stackebrandtia albiflava]TWJ12726.1 nucleotide sugar dehydrogenase [Stackebrandtia albiflava]
MRVCVVGLGKIGLPLAAQFATRGHRVSGADIDPRVVKAVNSGGVPFPGETGLADAVSAASSAGLLTATTDVAEAVAEAETTVVVVPLFVTDDGTPDFTTMDAATASVAAGLRPGSLVSYETTLPVGTTRNRLAPALEEGSGLVCGRDFHLAFSPERVFTGRVFTDLRRYPKLVGGFDEESASRAVAFYSAVLEFDHRPELTRPNGVWNLGTAEAAEFAKLAETTYRDVNIGLANQFARYADSIGVDVYDVIAACNTQPYSHIHRPGIAVGGHCIPVYPQLYLWNDPDATVVAAARAANATMPDYAVAALASAYGDLREASVLVLGAAYRGGVKETAYSGVFPLVDRLTELGARPVVSDPLYDPDELSALRLPPYRREPVDAIIVHTDHARYRHLAAADWPGVKVLIDGRRITDPQRWTGVRRLVIGDGAMAEQPD